MCDGLDRTEINLDPLRVGPGTGPAFGKVTIRHKAGLAAHDISGVLLSGRGGDGFAQRDVGASHSRWDDLDRAGFHRNVALSIEGVDVNLPDAHLLRGGDAEGAVAGLGVDRTLNGGATRDVLGAQADIVADWVAIGVRNS